MSCNGCGGCGCTSGCSCSGPTGAGQVAVSANDCPEYLDQKLVGAWLVTLTVLNPGSCWEQIEINTPCLKSTDGSVKFVADPLDWCLDMSACCPEPVDEKVAVDPTCPAGYLEDLIVPESGSAVRINKVNCKLEIGIDEAETPDEKVAVDSTCDWDYLENIVSGANGILVNKVIGGACKLMQTSIDLTWDGWKSPLCRKTVDETYDLVVPLATDTVVDLTWFTEIDETTTSWIGWTLDRLVAPKAWWYILDINGRVEVRNDWVSSIRIFNDSTNATNAFRIDEGWASTKQGPDPDLNPPRNPFYGAEGSLSNFSIWQSIPLFMAAGEEIKFVARISCQVDNALKDPATLDGRIRIRGNNGTPWSPVPGGWGWVNMSLRWHSDINGNRLYL